MPEGAPLLPTGDARDGDSFRLADERNARLWGYDAFELDQTGRSPSGETVPLGREARNALLPFLAPGASVSPTGGASYGRPVVALQQGSQDAGEALLGQGWGLATPEYLKGAPDRLSAYMEAERYARQNRRGAFGNSFQTPQSFRQGNPDPWAKPEPGKPGDGVAVFWDEPTPFQGLRKEVADGYLAIWTNPQSKPDDLLAYAAQNGFKLDPNEVRRNYAERDKGRKPGTEVTYRDPPRLLTDPGDGRIGAAVRGVLDQVNLLDETGAVVASLGGMPGRENVWDSERRFGDVYANNLTQNRAILDYDNANYPYTRFAGQLAGGLLLPGGAVRGVGLSAARQVLREGGSRLAAEAAARSAVTRRLAGVGAVYGGTAGAGAGEDLQERVTGAALGAPLGAGLGVGLGYAAPKLADLASRPFRRTARNPEEVYAPQQFVDGALDAERARVEDAVPDLAARSFDNVDAPSTQAMATEFDTPILESGLNDIPPPPPGFRRVDRLDVNDRATPLLDDMTDLQRLRAAERVDPESVLPIPSSQVASLEEAERIAAGRIQPVAAPDERAELGSRLITSPIDASRTMPKRGPLDLVTWLRTQGGIKAQGGELDYFGIDNTPRQLDFAGGEGRFGKLVSNDGMDYDYAALRAWEEGYFPELQDRPTINQFLDALNDTHTGRARRFTLGDRDEVERFYAARDQRYAVEGAREAGAPLAVDRGRPVTMDDLDRNSAPISAYEEWGENAPDFAGNIDLRKLDTPQAIRRALVQVERVTGGFDAARRGRISNAETAALASELNMTPRQLLGRRKGQAFNAEQALAARQILAKSGNEIVNMARAIRRGEATEQQMLAWREAIVRHSAIQEQVAGVTAEAGRTLQAFRMVADSRAVTGRVLDLAMDRAGGADGLRRAADMIIEAADDPKRLNTVAKALAAPGLKDKLVEVWYNFLLSGPRTHAVNITSNLLTSMAQLPEHAAAAGVGAVRKLMPSQTNTDRVLFSELGARTFGFLQGAREGLIQAGRTLKTGQTSDLESKVEAQTVEAVSGLKGKVLRIPTRVLSAEDEFFKATARRMEVSGLAVRQARSEGLRGEAARKRIAELVANPTPEMLQKASDYGRYVAFQRQLGPGGQALLNVTNRNPALKLFIPFIRTPMNLLKFTAERSPAAPILKEWRDDIAAGGVRRDLATARMMLGTGAIMTALLASAEGMITGNGPADQRARRLLEADGWQPYSIKIGNKYYSYQRLDPFSTTIGMAADYRDVQEYMTEKEREETVNLLVASAVQNLGNKTWLSGMSSLGEAITDPERYGGNLIARTVASATTPALMAQTAQAVDPISRDAQGTLARVRSRIPGLSKSLPPRRDVLGQPIRGANGGGLAAFSPVFSAQRRNDPIPNALLAAGVGISKPNRTMNDPTRPGKKVTLTPEQFDTYQRVVGEEVRPALNALLTGPGWRAMSRDDRQDAVDRIMKSARRTGRARVFGLPKALAGPPANAPRLPPPPPEGFKLVR